MIFSKLYRRIVRRETHQSRSTASVIVLAIIALGGAYVGIELVLALLRVPPLLVAPKSAVAGYLAADPWFPLIGLGALIFGVVLVLVALVPSRRARHSIAHERMAVVIDDGVLAGALAGRARLVASIGADRVRASVGRSSATVLLTPTSGIPLSRAEAQAAADELLGSLNPSPAIRARVKVSESAVVGS